MSYKALAMARSIVEEIRLRLPALALVEGNDAAGNPTITIGDGVSNHANAFIRVMAQPFPLATDIVGHVNDGFSPTVIQLGTEANQAAGVAADNLSPAQIAALLGTLITKGARLEWYQHAFGAVATIADLVAASLVATFEGHPYWSVMANQ